MSKIRTGSDVRNSADLQGLVTAMILRQSAPFASDEIIDAVNGKLDGSAYQGNPEVIDCCRRSIALFCIEGILKYLGNKEYVVASAFPAI